MIKMLKGLCLFFSGWIIFIFVQIYSWNIVTCAITFIALSLICYGGIIVGECEGVRKMVEAQMANNKERSEK
jgi:hypothetical protein